MTRLAPLGDDGDVLNEHQPHAKCRALLLSAAVMACVGLFGQRMEPARAHVSDWSYMVIHQKPNGLCQLWTELVARACRTGFNMIYLFRTLCQCLKALVPNNNKKCQKCKASQCRPESLSISQVLPCHHHQVPHTLQSSSGNNCVGLAGPLNTKPSNSPSDGKLAIPPLFAG